jgi:iron-sulfur cluster repair protein YtfE (RIC family)
MTTIDSTVMIAIHDALRRDMETVARRAADPNGQLDAALGWELFTRFLDIHHRAEDDLLWPMLIATMDENGGGAEDRELVAALEEDHQRIDPIVEHIQAVLAGASGERLPDVVDDLVSTLGAHLLREEADGLPMMGRVLSEEQWMQFSQASGGRIADDAARFLPWMLNDAENADEVLLRMPPPLREAYVGGWRGDYAELAVWP